MEGNTLMDIEEAALIMLRKGCSVSEVQAELMRVLNELKSMSVYLQAIKDADFAP
jgi:hypothetical protein